jgi:hypothetical protein
VNTETQDPLKGGYVYNGEIPTSPRPVAATAQQTESEEIVNTPIPVKAFGKTYQIKRFTLGPAFRALEYVGPFGYLLRTVLALPRDSEGKLAIGQDELIDLAVTAISISGPSVLGLISVATNEPPEWLEDKDVFEGVDVLAAVLEKNLDFFSPENIEKVTKVLGGLQRSILAYGGSTSTTS